MLQKSQYKSRRRTEVFFAANDRKRFIVHADQKLTAFLELEAAICACGELS
jgi:hypothetical protein